MSEQALENEGDPSDVIEGELDENHEKVSPDKAGWTTREDWIASGKPESEWRSAEHFELVKETHGLRTTIKNQRAEIDGFDSRLKSVETLAQAGNEAQIADLQDKLEDAIADGQVDKSKAYQKDINELEAKKTPDVESVAADPVLIAWNKDNPWIGNESPKSNYAMLLYNQGRADNMSSQEIIEMVNREVEKEYPGTITTGGQPKTKVVNARRAEASTTVSGKTNPGGKTTGLSMSDVTGDERRVRENSVYMANLTDEKYLKLVERARASEAADNG